MIISNSSNTRRSETLIAARYLINDPTGVMDIVGSGIMLPHLPEFSFRLKDQFEGSAGAELEQVYITNGTPKEGVMFPIAICVCVVFTGGTSEENDARNAKVSDIIRAVWRSMYASGDLRFLDGRLAVKQT